MLTILSRKIRKVPKGWLGDSTKWPEGQAKPCDLRRRDSQFYRMMNNTFSPHSSDIQFLNCRYGQSGSIWGYKMTGSNFISTALFAFGMAVSGAMPSFAETIKHQTQFSVRFGGLEIGVAKFDIQFDEQSYQLVGSGKTTGLVQWFAPSTGRFVSAGEMIENQLRPAKHEVSVKERKKSEESVRLAFANESITDVQIKSIKPRKKREAPNYVPVQAQHMAKVLDPVSTLIVPMSGTDARSGKKVCDQRFPVFDGETRYDIKLSYKSTKPVKTKGYNGNAYVCQMRYIPVAGHKKGHRTVKEMASNKNMEIWLAPMAGVSVFTPIQIRIGTKFGRFVASPKYFGPAG